MSGNRGATMKHNLFGMDVYVNDTILPTEIPSTPIIPAHPLIRFLSKWIKVSPWVAMETKIECVHEAYIINGRMLTSPCMWEHLKREAQNCVRITGL